MLPVVGNIEAARPDNGIDARSFLIYRTMFKCFRGVRDDGLLAFSMVCAFFAMVVDAI